MDLFAVGTPVLDVFARCSERKLSELGLEKGATSYFSAKEMAKIQRKLAGKIFHLYAGDNARNVCEGFSALGGFCSYQGTVGSDRDGALFEANLEECGIANFLQEKRGATGKIIAIITPDNERTFCADLGVSGDCSATEEDAFSRSKFFFTTSITLACGKPVSALALKYLDKCKKSGKRVAISIENPPMVQKNSKMLLAVVKKYADVLLMNETEADALLGKGAEKLLLKLKPRIPIYLKKGKHGSILYLNKKAQRIPALAAKPIDTTGAGDAYAAGVLYGLTRNYSPYASARIGCMLATKVVEKVGAGIPLAHTRIRIRHRK